LCKVSCKGDDSSVTAHYVLPDGGEWNLKWTIEPKAGDIILRSSGRAKSPVEEIRYIIFDCNIADHSLVWVDQYGVGHVTHGPSEDLIAIGDPEKDSSASTLAQPLVALFQGEKTGWLIEGRDPRIGPANLLAQGKGNGANVGMVRRFPVPTMTPALYEIRIRTYRDHWEDAVDPHIAWMEREAGFVPLDKRSPAWVKEIRNQAYVRVGNFDGLEALAKAVDPRKTFLGRMVGWRYFPMDHKYPDYRMPEESKKWVHRAKELGFRIGLHFNSACVATCFPELIERFRPGFLVTGKDDKGVDIYQGVGDLIACSPAFKPWREYLIAQMKEAIDTGVDVVYLDGSMAPNGKYVIDGMDGIEALMLMMKEALQAYPNIALETEQFNPMTVKYASFALSQMPLGHSLGGYILHRFTNVVPEGVCVAYGRGRTEREVSLRVLAQGEGTAGHIGRCRAGNEEQDSKALLHRTHHRALQHTDGPAAEPTTPLISKVMIQAAERNADSHNRRITAGDLAGRAYQEERLYYLFVK
jgi:hypothetical protein